MNLHKAGHPRVATLIQDWEARLQGDRLALRVIAALHERQGEAAKATLDVLEREHPELRRVSGDKYRQLAHQHCHDNVAAITAIATGQTAKLGPDPLHFVRSHAIARARQQIPLAAVLRAYRLAHKGYWAIIRDAAAGYANDRDQAADCVMMLSDFFMEYFDIVGTVLTEAYAAEEKLFATRRTRAHVAMMEDLLRGVQPTGPEARDLCERCGIRPGAHMAIAIARPLPRSATDADAGVQGTLPQLIEQILTLDGLGKLVDVRDDDVIAIVAGHHRTSRAVEQALRGALDGADPDGRFVGVGVSQDATDIGGLLHAYEEARRALDFVGPSRRVVHFADIDLIEFLIRRSDETVFRLVPAWANHLTAADRGNGGDLSRTIHAFAECSLNVKATAKRLGLHTNTVYFRLNRIGKLTGVDPRSFAGVSLLLTTLRLLDAQGRQRSG